MKDREHILNLIIMIGPLILPAIIILMIFGESFIFFAIPLVIFLTVAIKLSKKISRKDAVSYPFVQYPFLFLVGVFTYIEPPGLGLILILPLIFLVNIGIIYAYFWYAEKKRWFSKVGMFLLTLVVTIIIYPSISALTPTPVIQYGEFSFRIVYEIDGAIHEIEDVIMVNFAGVSHGDRRWSTNLKSENSPRFSVFRDFDVPSVFTRNRINKENEISFWVGSGGYFMGDRRSNSPSINYRETYSLAGGGSHIVTRSITKQQLAEHFGIQIIEWEFCEPIQNSFRLFHTNP